MLGFSLLKHSFQFVNVEYREGRPVVERFASRRTPVPFNLENALKEEQRAHFRGIIGEAAEVFKLKGPVVVSVDSHLAFVKKFLVDLGAELNEIEEQLNWEFRQILPEPSLEEYQFVFDRLPGGFYEGQDAVVAVAFRKTLLDTVRDLFAPAGLEVQWIDLDVFSALYAINRLYGTREFDLCVLVDVREDLAKIQFVRKGEFFDLYTVKFSELEENEVHTFDSPESVAKLLKKEIQRKLIAYKLDSEEKPVDTLYLYGEKADQNMADVLITDSARDVVFVEPFQKLEMDVPEESSQEVFSSRYTACVGSALRSVI